MTKNSSALNCCELTVVVFVLECVQRVCVIVCASECVSECVCVCVSELESVCCSVTKGHPIISKVLRPLF